MSEAIRAGVKTAFQNARRPHPGLLLARGLREQEAVGEAGKAGLIERVAALATEPLYGAAFGRWRAALAARPNVCLVEMAAPGGLIVGLGASGVLETGITLHQAYGTPLIPGSALKGLARHFAAEQLAARTAEGDRLADGGDLAGVLFGSVESASYLTYFDAWYVPGSAPDDRPLAGDVITVHHPRYYTGSARRAPWDFDDPNPVPFLHARGRYLIAVGGPELGWARLAIEVLVAALGEYGAGGKTGSGYGRLVPHGAIQHSTRPSPSAADRQGGPDQTDPTSAAPPSPAHPLLARVAGLRAATFRQDVGGILTLWRAIGESAVRTSIAAALIARIGEIGESRWAMTRAWWAELESAAATGNGDA